MNKPNFLTSFELPGHAPPLIQTFHALWLDRAAGGLPDVSDFDVAALSAEYPLLARICGGEPGKPLVWGDVAASGNWPFKPPVKGCPLADSVPTLGIKRVIAAFEETLSSGVPDYFETTSWMQGGRTVSMARLVAPLISGAGRELISVWEIMEPPSVS